MGIRYPGSNMQELNLDWVLSTVKENTEKVDTQLHDLTELEEKVDGAVYSVDHMTVEANTLQPEDDATATKSIINGHINIEFGIPKGEKGDPGQDGAPGTPATDAQIQTAVNTWLSNNVDPDSGYVLDSTLTQPLAAAPADIVGEIKAGIAGEFNASYTYQVGSFVWYQGSLYCFVKPHAANDPWSASEVTVTGLGNAVRNSVYNVAPYFSESASYTGGEYVVYYNMLFKFTSDHAAGAWDASEVTSVHAMDEVETLNDDVDDLKSAITNFNAYDIFADKLTRTSATHNGFTFTWSGDVCTVTGAAEGYGVNILLASTALPNDVIPGSTYYVKYKTTNDEVKLRIVWRTAANADVRTDYFTGNTSVTVPSTAEKWTVALFIGNTVTFSASVTVSDIAFLNTRSNADLNDLLNSLPTTYFEPKGVLAANTDLDTVRTQGYYVMSSGYTYTHSPLPAGVAGILYVYPASANSVQQEIMSVAGPKFTDIYIRSSILGSFSNPWKKIGGADNNYLESTNDYTDRTTEIQEMLDDSGVCRLGPGRFVVTGISVPDYGALIGSGTRTVMVLADSVTTGQAVKLNNYAMVSNLRIYGGGTAYGSSSSVGTRHGVLFKGTKASGQSGGVTKKKSIIDKCTIYNFSGGGITCTGTGTDLDSNIVVSDCFIDHCGAGIYIPYYSEFHRFSNCVCNYNYYGCVDNGGNNNFSCCDFSGNRIGILIDNSTDQSPNNSHGTFSSCSVNHSYSDAGVINKGTAIKLLKANLGEIFTGMQIYYGAIILDKCVGTRIVGANIGGSVPITITNSTVVTFSDCTFKDAPDSADSAFSQSNNTVLKFTDCYLRNGTVYNPVS